MNWLDRTIGFFSPKSGLQRARLRYAMQSVSLAYEGAKTGRRTDGWLTAGNSANADIGAALHKLRERSRDLVQNNHYAARVLRVLSSHTVGTGILPKAATGDEKLDALVDALWAEWAAQCNADGRHDFYALESLVTRTVPESGECLVRFRPRRASDGLAVPLQIQVLEPDYLDTSKTGETDAGYIIQGVQFNKLGKREGYWLFAQHPGEVTKTAKRYNSAFVPESEVLHIYEPLRPGQVRGVPWFAPVLLKFRDLAEYDEAELMRKKIEACFAAFVTQSDGADGLTIGKPAADKDGNRIESFEPGMVEYLRPGEDVKFGAPAGGGGFSDYYVTQLTGLAAGMNVMYEQMTGDRSRVNYSSYRGGLIDFRPFVEMFRWHVLIPLFCQAVWDRFVASAYGAGKLPVDKVAVEWTAPSFQSVDPVKDAEADLMQIRTGTLTLPEAIARQGYDPDKQLQSIADTNGKLDELGIVLDCDPRKVAKGGTKQKDGNDGERTAA